MSPHNPISRFDQSFMLAAIIIGPSLLKKEKEDGIRKPLHAQLEFKVIYEQCILH